MNSVTVLVPAQRLNELTPLVPPEVTLFPYQETGPPPPELHRADAVLRWQGGERFSELVHMGNNIRWLHTESAGVDMVLTPAVRDKPNLTLTNSGSAFAIPIAEFVLGWMLSVTHRQFELRDSQQQRQWAGLKQGELFGQTAGIVGMGPIGLAIAERCRVMGMKTIGFRRHAKSVPGVDDVRTGSDGLRSLLSESDWVVLAAALTGETQSLLGENEFDHMKKGAWLVNIARGKLVDESALVDALQSGQLGGACLDVFAQEPLPAESVLWGLPNVFLSPHNSWGRTDGLHRRQIALFVTNMERFVRGETLQNVVDRTRGY